jgi:hypothetical protein
LDTLAILHKGTSVEVNPEKLKNPIELIKVSEKLINSTDFICLFFQVCNDNVDPSIWLQ